MKLFNCAVFIQSCRTQWNFCNNTEDEGVHLLQKWVKFNKGISYKNHLSLFCDYDHWKRPPVRRKPFLRAAFQRQPGPHDCKKPRGTEKIPVSACMFLSENAEGDSCPCRTFSVHDASDNERPQSKLQANSRNAVVGVPRPSDTTRREPGSEGRPPLRGILHSRVQDTNPHASYFSIPSYSTWPVTEPNRVYSKERTVRLLLAGPRSGQRVTRFGPGPAS